MTGPRDRLTDIFRAVIEAADPYEGVLRRGDEILAKYRKGRYKRLFVFGFGKAVPPMLRAIADKMGSLVTGGVAIAKRGCPAQAGKALSVRAFEAGHPLPDEAGLRATMEAVRLARTFDDETFLICLISGGGSALLVAPYTGVSLKEKQEATELLLKAGADIRELNAVRKHASLVKGGRLAEIAAPATIESLILSDVIGDPLDVIASGPTAPDSPTYGDALRVIEKYRLDGKVPRALFHLLAEGARGRVPETPKKGSPVFERTTNVIVGSNKSAIEAGRRKAARLGFEAAVLSTEVRGEARAAGRWLAEKAKEAKGFEGRKADAGKPLCLISGGETTVAVKGRGLGGRNMELALAFALEIEGEEGITLLSAGTDGGDGPTDAAGAIVDGQTATRARQAGLDPKAYLEENDSYGFFRGSAGLFVTGPTGTNVMDVQIALIEGGEASMTVRIA